jgi:hypothetical protein
MTTKVGVGKSNGEDPFKAGCNAAQMALDRAGVNKCDFVFVFSTVGYDQGLMLRGIRSVTGNAPLSGCSGEGLITQDGPEGEVLYALSGPQHDKEVVGVMAFASDEISFYNFIINNVKNDSFKAGEAIGTHINENRVDDTKLLLMFPDAYTTKIHQET